MTDATLTKLLIKSNENLSKSVGELNEKFGRFVEIEAARSEREKHQQEEIQYLQVATRETKKSLQQYKDDNAEVLRRSNRLFTLMDSVSTKIITGVVIIILISAGIVTLPSMVSSASESKSTGVQSHDSK